MSLTDFIALVAALGALAAAVAGFTAVWVALKTHRESQATMRQVTRPIVEFTTWFDAQGYSAKLHNAGQGPALLKAPIFAVLGGQTREMRGPDDVDALMRDLGGQLGLNIVPTEKFVVLDERALQPTAGLTIVVASFISSANRDQLQMLPRLLQWSIKYESLFGDRWEARSDG